MLRYFKTFLVAAETGSFSSAGARLGLTQSAVSTQIRRLEEDLGCTLFDRSGKSVTLSEEGRQMLADASRIVALYESMKGARLQRDTAPLDLGAVSTVQASLLPRAMQRFRVAFPDTHVNIVPGMSTQLLTQVDARELDIAVLVKPR
ncbi:MAG TPA: LysR family transcriptional regulator, partial [Cupriavidus sp.]|nr:LysR family transcriptional regulator [Cupriavidus sp.]